MKKKEIVVFLYISNERGRVMTDGAHARIRKVNVRSGWKEVGGENSMWEG